MTTTITARGRQISHGSISSTPAGRLSLPSPASRDTVEDLEILDETVEVLDWPAVVRLGLGAIGYIHPGNVVDVTDGATAYLAPGAHLEEIRPGALERGDITVVPWTPPDRP
jgi:hypothetical protein